MVSTLDNTVKMILTAKGTYDITWYAYYGWIWTALEADYFSTSTMSGRYGSSNTPIPLSRSRGKGISLPSSHSVSASHVEPNSRHGSVPFTGIKVSRDLDVHVEEWDKDSQKSFASTKELTALPASGEKGSDNWAQGYQPDRAQKTVRIQIRDADIERGQQADRDWPMNR
jgi:hypothetical protein